MNAITYSINYNGSRSFAVATLAEFDDKDNVEAIGWCDRAHQDREDWSQLGN